MDYHVLSSNLEVAVNATSIFNPCDIVTSTKKTRYISEVDIMRKNLTEIVFILDRSGSMSGLEADTIGGYNSLLEKQKKEDGEAIVSTVLFDDTQEVLHDRVDLNKMKAITDKEYYVRGCTALLDAVGLTIKHIENIHKYIRKEDVPEHTVFVITTDGYENASQKFDSKTVKDMVKEKTDKCGWEFIFLGANIDAVHTASGLGIKADNAATFTASSAGVASTYDAMDEAMCCIRGGAPMSAVWKKRVK